MKKLLNKLNRKLDKLKKKAMKLKDALMSQLKDQAFYLKDAAKSAKAVGILTLQYLILFMVVAASSFSASTLHSSFIDYRVGQNTLMLMSPKGAKLQGLGTGFEVIAPSGRVLTLTNAHVCGLAKDGILMVDDKLNSHRLVPKRVIEVFQENDLCVVEGLAGYSGLELASNSEVGQKVWAIGYPLGQGLNVSSGRIKDYGTVLIAEPEVAIKNCNAPNQKVFNIPSPFGGAFQVCTIKRMSTNTDVPTYPGNSGSPLVNMFGTVVGVIFASNNETHWGAAVPLKDVKRFLSAY